MPQAFVELLLDLSDNLSPIAGRRLAGVIRARTTHGFFGPSGFDLGVNRCRVVFTALFETRQKHTGNADTFIARQSQEFTA